MMDNLSCWYLVYCSLDTIMIVYPITLHMYDTALILISFYLNTTSSDTILTLSTYTNSLLYIL